MGLSLNTIVSDFNSALEMDLAWRKKQEYDLNFFWEGNNSQLIKSVISEADSIESLIKSILCTELYTHHVPDELVSKSIEWHITEYLKLGFDLSFLPGNIQESELFPDNQTKVVDNRRVSPDFFRHAYMAHAATNLLANIQRPKVLELGAGTGAFASIFRKFNPQSSYVICDIPESLVFARSYLYFNNPAANIVWAESAKDIEINLNKADYLLIPTRLAGHIQNMDFDLFMNFHSLGEFDNSAIKYWMSWINGIDGPKYVLMVNRFLNFLHPKRSVWRLKENEASVSFGKNWKTIDWEIEPKHLACPYSDTVHSRYLLYAATRVSEQPNANVDLSAETHLAKAKEYAEIRILSADKPTSFRHDMLVVSNGTDSALFHLWNSIRLKEDTESIYLLTRYLFNTFKLNRDRTLEEIPYYLTKLWSLIENGNSSSNPSIKKWTSNKIFELNLAISTITLIEEYKGYNIVFVGDILTLAIKQSTGSIDLFNDVIGYRELAPLLFKMDHASDPTLESRMSAIRARIDVAGIT